MIFAQLLPDLVALALALALGSFVMARRPRSPVWPSILWYFGLAALFAAGSAWTRLASTPAEKSWALALQYLGGAPAIAAWSLFVWRFAHGEGVAFGAVSRWPYSRAVIAWGALVGLVLFTNPWHGWVLEPVVGGREVFQAGWWWCLAGAYALFVATAVILARLVWLASNRAQRINAALLLTANALVLAAHASYVSFDGVSYDPTTSGLAVANVLFAVGIFRTRLFSLPPGVLFEVLRYEPDVVLIGDADGRLLFANESARATLGIANIEGGRLFPLLAARFRQAAEVGSLAEGAVGSCLSDGGSSSLEWCLEDGHVEERWFAVKHRLIPIRQGTQWAQVVRLRDITHPRQERLARLASEARFRLLVDSSPLGILATDRDGEPVLWNPAAKRLLSSSSLTASEASAVVTPARERVFDLCRLSISREASILEEISFGEAEDEVTLRVHVVPLADHPRTAIRHFQESKDCGVERRGPLGALVLAEDVSAQRIAERERELFKRRMEEAEKLESIGVLAGGVAHDFNNLLTAILGHAELALDRLTHRQLVVNHLREICSASQHAHDLVGQLLDITGEEPRRQEVVDCVGLVQGMATLLESVGRDVPFALQIGSRVPPVMADRTQLRQVLMNLLINAADAQEDRPGRVRLEVGSCHLDAADRRSWVIGGPEGPGEYVVLRVSDEGCGMDEETRQRIFEPFFTTKSSGRGLGLAASLGILRAHGAFLSVESELGKGTAFTAFLPAQRRVANSERVPARERHRATVLVVDDEQSVRDVIEATLCGSFSRVLMAQSGEEALSWIDSEGDTIDVVLLDLHMPVMSGSETLAAIREVAPELPVVVMSGYASKRRKSLMSDPHTLTLGKPFNAERLIATLREAMPSRSQRMVLTA